MLSVTLTTRTGDGIIDDCHLYLDIKETQIGHFPSVWTDNDVGYMPISDSEDATLFTLTDFYGNNDLLFWFVPLNLVHNTPL